MGKLEEILKPAGDLLKPLYRVWMKFVHVIGKINTVLLLSLFYFVFLGIAKLFATLSRKNLLDSRWKDRESYWKKREHFQVNREAFLKPY